MKKLLLVMLSGVSCASYQFGQARRQLPGGYDRLAIPIFMNRTPEVGIETYFTDALKMEFERSRLATVLPKDQAQVVIEGAVTKVLSVPRAQTSEIKDPLGKTTNVLPKDTLISQEYGVVVNVHLILRKLANDQVLWEGDFSNEKSYRGPQLGSPGLSNSNAIYNLSGRVLTIAQLSEVMMSEAHDQITENF